MRIVVEKVVTWTSIEDADMAEEGRGHKNVHSGFLTSTETNNWCPVD